MRCEPHPLDIQLSRPDATHNPLSNAYLTWSHGVQHDLAVDIEVWGNFIAMDLVNLMDLKMEHHPDPYYIDDHEFV